MAIFGSRSSRPIHWLSTGIEEARRVGRIHSRDVPIGTGFLFDGCLIDDAYKELPLLLTCNHCVSGTGDRHPAATPWSKAAVVFQQMQAAPAKGEAGFLLVLAESPVEGLNYTLLLLDRWPGPVSPLKLAPKRPQPETGDRVFVISYPMGGGLAVSLDDNAVVGPTEAGISSEKMVHYRAPTEMGSSGAPVFNEHWELVAIHVGGARLLANSGVAIDVVVADAQAKLRGFSIPEKTRDLVGQQTSDERPSALRDSPGYYSVFISYRHEDAAFARRLFHALKSQGVRAWFDEAQVVPGQFIQEAIQSGIQNADRFVLCCSKASLENSWWVDSEIAGIFEKERELSKMAGRKLSVVIPLQLDDYLTEAWKGPKATEVRQRYATDFREWQDDRRFEESLGRLLVALRAA